MPTILITGFGPFPGAPYNPTMKLVRALARLRRPALADTTIATHIFTTSYAAVDRDLPALIAQHRPDALLMFGLHGRAKAIRIETRARNALALLPDASGKVLRRGVIAPGSPAARRMPMPAQRLLAAFVQVPPVSRFARPKKRHKSFRVRPLHARRGVTGKRLSAADLLRVGEKVLAALNAAVNRT
jgi:pyroglutamyl-peptidase